MSGSVHLTIETGAVWAWQFTWRDGAGNPVPFSSPTMNIRQGLNTTEKLIARLDEAGTYNGTLTITEPGVLVIEMTSDQTNALKPGYGFWDIYVNVYGNRARMLFGTVDIAAHVTELS